MRSLFVTLIVLSAASARGVAAPFAGTVAPTLQSQVEQAEAVLYVDVVRKTTRFVGGGLVLGSTDYLVLDVVAAKPPEEEHAAHFAERERSGARVVLDAVSPLAERERGLLFLKRLESGTYHAWATLGDSDGTITEYLKAARAAGDLTDTERLLLYFKWLEHPTESIARDAYRAFAVMPRHASLQKAAPDLPTEKLKAWIASEEIPAARRGFYCLLLGMQRRPEGAAVLKAILDANRSISVRDLVGGAVAGYALVAEEPLRFLCDTLRDPDASVVLKKAVLSTIDFLHDYESFPSAEALRDALLLALDNPFLVEEAIRMATRWKDEKAAEAIGDAYRRWADLPGVRDAVRLYFDEMPCAAGAELGFGTR